MSTRLGLAKEQGPQGEGQWGTIAGRSVDLVVEGRGSSLPVVSIFSVRVRMREEM